jgi:hypothetical protein
MCDRDAEPHPAFQLTLVSKRSTSSLARASDDAADALSPSHSTSADYEGYIRSHASPPG